MKQMYQKLCSATLIRLNNSAQVSLNTQVNIIGTTVVSCYTPHPYTRTYPTLQRRLQKIQEIANFTFLVL